MEKFVKKWLFLSSSLFLFGFFTSFCQVYYNKAIDISNNSNFFGYGSLSLDSSIYVDGVRIKPDGFWEFNLTKINIMNGDTLWTQRNQSGYENYYTGGSQSIIELNGNIYYCGTLDSAGVIYKPFIAKTKPDGTMTQFTKLSCSNQVTGLSSFIFKRNYFYACGYTFIGANKNMYLVKIDTLGNVIWEKNFGGGGVEFGYNIDTNYDNGFILGGYTNSYGAGSYDAYLVKTDSLGNFQWHKWFGNADSDWGFVKSQADSTYLLYGGMHNSAGTIASAYIYKLNSSGIPIWQKSPLFPIDNTSSLNEIEQIILDEYSNIIAVGNYTSSIIGGNPIGFIYKCNQNGDSLLFCNYFNRSNDNYLNSISALPDGGFIMAGFVFSDTTAGSTEDGWIIRVDSLGCESMSCALSVDETNSLTTNDVLVYPNPAQNNFTIKTNTNEVFDLSIYDLTGKLLEQINLKNNELVNGYTHSINNYTNGIYFLRLNNSKRSVSIKLIKN